MLQLLRLANIILFWFVLILIIKQGKNEKLTSIYYGNQGLSMDEVRNVSSWVGKRQTVVVLFTDWCNASMEKLFDIELTNIWNNQSIPLVTWQITGCNGRKLPGVMKEIHNNSYDTYINQFGDRLKTWLAGNDTILGNDDDRRVYIRLAHEMNGHWYSWSMNSTPTDYVLSWHHIHHIISNKSLNWTRIQWIWCVYNADVGPYKAEEYWVGDDYTNWLGIDGYNFGKSSNWSSWTWPTNIYHHMIDRLRNISSTKPIAINEYGSTTIHAVNASNIQLKIEWLHRFCDYINSNQIKMASYFNKDKETDWAIFGGMRGDVLWNNFHAYSAYKDCLQSDDWIQPNTTNPRLITDEQFAGRF